MLVARQNSVWKYNQEMSSNVECVMNILEIEKEKGEEGIAIFLLPLLLFFPIERGIIEIWKMINKTNKNNALDANKIERNCCRHCTGDI